MPSTPLYRALRVDKLTLAALEGCLILAESHRHHGLPVWNMLERSADELYREAEQIAAQLPNAEVTSVMSYSGGGALPDRGLSDWAVKIAHPKAGKIAISFGRGIFPLCSGSLRKPFLFIQGHCLMDKH